jgi:hypothetical protein
LGNDNTFIPVCGGAFAKSPLPFHFGHEDGGVQNRLPGNSPKTGFGRVLFWTGKGREVSIHPVNRVWTKVSKPFPLLLRNSQIFGHSSIYDICCILSSEQPKLQENALCSGRR